MKYWIFPPWDGVFFRDLRSLARKLANPFCHQTESSTCGYLQLAASPFRQGLMRSNLSLRTTPETDTSFQHISNSYFLRTECYHCLTSEATTTAVSWKVNWSTWHRLGSFNWVHMWQASCILLGSALSNSFRKKKKERKLQSNVSWHFPVLFLLSQ